MRNDIIERCDAIRTKLSTRLPYALCKEEGINTEGMTPREAWEAYAGKTGANPKEVMNDKFSVEGLSDDVVAKLCKDAGINAKGMTTYEAFMAYQKEMAKRGVTPSVPTTPASTPKASPKKKAAPKKAPVAPVPEPTPTVPEEKEEPPKEVLPKEYIKADVAEYSDKMKDFLVMNALTGEKSVTYADKEGHEYSFDGNYLTDNETGEVIDDAGIFSNITAKFFGSDKKKNDDKYVKFMSSEDSRIGYFGGYEFTKAKRAYDDAMEKVKSGEITDDSDEFVSAKMNYAKTSAGYELSFKSISNRDNLADYRKQIIEQYKEAGGDPFRPKKIGKFKIGKRMTFEQADNGHTNPKFVRHTPYGINCQTCVVALEARLRGFDFSAKPKSTPQQTRLGHKVELAWIDPETGTYPKPVRAKQHSSSAEVYELFDKTIKEGERYNLNIWWHGGGGHIVEMVRDNGELRIYDPQTNLHKAYGKAACISYFDACTKDWRQPQIFRVDNCVFNLAVVNNIFEKAE